MDCKHIPYISVNQYIKDSNVFLCIGEGEEILNDKTLSKNEKIPYLIISSL